MILQGISAPRSNVGSSQMVLVVKYLVISAGDARDVSSIPGSGRLPEGGHGNPLQYSCPEHPIDRGSWQVQSIKSQRVGLD